MPQMDTDDTADKPLDPAMERVRRKMVRTLGVSIGIMCIGLMAVLGAIVYKFSSRPATPPGAETGLAVPADGEITARAMLPAGFSIEQVSLDGNRILFFGKGSDGTRHAYVYDVGAKRIVADIAIAQ